MSRTAVLAVRIITETKDAGKGFKDTSSKLDKFEAKLNKATVPAAAAGAAVLAFAKKTGDMASIAQQNAGAVDSVFKGNAKQVNAFAKTAADKLGLSASSYQQMASVIGSQMKNMGVPMDKVAGSTNDLIAKGADLAAMFGGSTADAVDALSSLLRGERDPIERYGVSINDAAIKAQKAKMGLKGLTGEADKNATLTATMALLNKQTADATGQFAREATSAAGAQEIANAKLQDAGAKMGSVFLPAMAAGAAALSSVATWASENSTVLLILAGVIAGVAGAILLVNGALKAWRAATAAVAAVQVVLNAVMAANPIALVVIAVAALVAGLIWAYQNVGWFKDFVDKAFAAVAAVVGAVAKWFGDAWRNAVNAVQGFLAGVGKFFQAVWAGAVGFVTGVVRGFQNTVAGIFRTVAVVVSVVVGTIRNYFAVGFAAVRAVVAGVVSGVRGTIDGIAGTVSRVVGTVRNGLAGAFQFVAGIGRSAFDGIAGAISNVIGWIQNALSWVRDLAGSIGGAVGKALGLGGATSAAGYLMAPAAAAPAGFAGGATSVFSTPSIVGTPRVRAAAPTIINVTVNGALDPAAVGKQIDGILQQHLRRAGAVTNGASPWSR